MTKKKRLRKERLTGVKKKKKEVRIDYLLHPEKSLQWTYMSKDERSLYKRYKNGASSRDKSFKIGLLYFCNLISSRCFYCGAKPYQLHNKLLYMGIDRIKNDVGYEYGNVISCCKKCNYAKGTMEFKEFTQWIHNTTEEYSLRKTQCKSHYVDVEYFQSRGISVNPNKHITNKRLLDKYKDQEHREVDKDYSTFIEQIVTVSKTY